jgi:hypothetical protein
LNSVAEPKLLLRLADTILLPTKQPQRTNGCLQSSCKLSLFVMTAAAGKSVFVTVGTTLFDALIAAANDDAVLLRLAHLGYTSVLMQTGRILC